MTGKEIRHLNSYLDLFLTFAQIGVCTFGGGYAMLPILQREVVEKRGWATENELMDYYAIGQCTPGVIAVNTSTFIGYRLRGVPGAIVATAGMVFPSLVIITIIAAFIQQFAHLAVLQHAFAGIRVAVCALVLPSVIIIILVSRALDRFRSSSLVQNGFYGLRPASAGLIFGAMFTVFADSLLHLDLWSGPESLLSVLNYRAILLFLVLSVAIRKLPKVHPIVFIGVGALAGIVFQF